MELLVVTVGTFYVNCEIVNVRHPSRPATVSKLLVDTSSEFTWIPEPVLKQVGVAIDKKDLPFVMPNGQTISRNTGYAILRVDDFETIDEVVFGQLGDFALLGARTQGGFGALVNARQKKLVAAGPRPAAGVLH